MIINGYRGIFTKLLALTLVVAAIAPAGAANASHRSGVSVVSNTNPTVVRRTIPHWKAYDEASYAVSSLNLPLCDNGRQLSTVLRIQMGARSYSVLQSTVDPDVFFIQVRATSRAPMAVFAYRLGFPLPEGVWSAHCVTNAPGGVVSLYRSGALVWLARFTSTLPAD